MRKVLLIVVAAVLAIAPAIAFAGFNLMEGEVTVSVAENPIAFVGDASKTISIFAGGRGIVTWTIKNTGLTDVDVSWSATFPNSGVRALKIPAGTVTVPAGGQAEIGIELVVDSDLTPGTELVGTLWVHQVVEWLHPEP